MRLKKTIYLICSVILGILLSYLAHAVIEIVYLQSAITQGKQITWYTHFGVDGCALPPYIQYGLLLVGMVGGLFLGVWWWGMVYEKKLQ